MRYVLGLDLGPTSIGWAVVELDVNGRPCKLIDANSRIFLAMVEADTKIPKNKNRREKRSMRKQVKRYKLRRSELVGLLTEYKFFDDAPLDPLNWENQLNQIGNPFQLRAEALESKLTPIQLARVFLHLLKRRGYKSNRGAKFDLLLSDLKARGISIDFNDTDTFEETEDAGSADEKARETGTVLNGIRLLRQAMQEKELEWKPNQPCTTIAQLMVKIKEKEKFQEVRRPHTLTRSEVTKKGKETQYHLHASRELYEDEFNQIWAEQVRYYPQLLSDDFKIKVHQAIFFQRPLLSQRRKVGKCSFEIKKSRAAKALLNAQEFLLLDNLNKLKYSLPKTEGQMVLSDEQRHALLIALDDPGKVNEKGQLSWAETKKITNLPPKAKFNLELTSKNGLTGNRTHLAMLRTIPGKWLVLGQGGNSDQTFTSIQIQLIQDLVHIEDKQALFNRLTNRYALPASRNPWNFTPEEAFRLVTLELNEGYVKHCSQVINKLLPPMRQGLMYHDAVQAASYKRRDQIATTALAKLPEPSDIANPVVQKALFETRRLVNELIDKYGKPALVRLEMARDMKASKIHRAEMEKRQKDNQKNNEAAAIDIRALAKTYPDLGIRVSREAILKYKLWLEQGKSCAYTHTESSHDRKISDRMLFDGTVEVDHIYPLSVSLDDSYMNKVLCFRTENMSKGRQTPWQAWNGTEKYAAILRRFDRANLPDYPVGKLRRLKDDKFDANADFVSAQLNDTRYICVAVRNYLAMLGYNDQELQVSRGQMTAELRRLWGLLDVLPRTQDTNEIVDQETGEISEKAAGKKKDRGDHRHHAIDAIVTALVDHSIFADLMRRYRYREERGIWPDQPLECSIPDLRSETERIVMNNVVSHAANRKISGGLHDELPYGLGTYIEKAVPLKKLLQQPGTIRCEPDGTKGKTLEGGERWIADASIRELVRQWLDGYDRVDKGKRKNYPLPLQPDGKEITAVDVINRCFVKRAGVESALTKVENDPGKKTWIVDQGVRKALIAWLGTHKPKDALTDPPRMPRKDGDITKAHPIFSVRMASKSSGMVRFKDKPQIFEKGSNHHVAIFKHVRPDGTCEWRGVLVNMLEAARRVHDQPVVRKNSSELSRIDPTIKPDEWNFEMALCSQDMILWDKEHIPDDHRHLGPPIYRLQKMSMSEDKNINLIFRHFSVTSTGDADNRGVIRKFPHTMPTNCRKIKISALGTWNTIGDD